MLLVIRGACASIQQRRYLSEVELNTPVLLIEDGVYQYAQLKQAALTLYVNINDGLARGIDIEQSHRCAESHMIELTQKHPHWIDVK
ncbi:DsrH/TusB family sulfur relay protein [Alteromonas sp. C1M14]|uniref:DsrH/TusB family sulfur relay protein n=1 Tax=Alteromonas sp. C1M14 TaxID=2841567 RepID=UPI001C0880F1|nr:DsrH/TusB family sulfur relay protein [Alteromonas sp. C1M14]MBU2976826.1 DsrH/TusB family sulfur relay protein [Alteromonas sp. C1M14]